MGIAGVLEDSVAGRAGGAGALSVGGSEAGGIGASSPVGSTADSVGGGDASFLTVGI